MFRRCGRDLRDDVRRKRLEPRMKIFPTEERPELLGRLQASDTAERRHQDDEHRLERRVSHQQRDAHVPLDSRSAMMPSRPWPRGGRRQRDLEQRAVAQDLLDAPARLASRLAPVCPISSSFL